MDKKINVMIVDDSAVVRQVLTEMLSTDKNICVYAAAQDPIFAMKRMEKQWPDVIVLDVEMPRMDGITFLRKLMSERPTPVVVCSSLTEKGAEVTMHALDAGAVSVITKPKARLKDFLIDSANDVITAVKTAARARIQNVSCKAATKSAVQTVKRSIHNDTKPTFKRTTDRVIAIGTSTGGTQALEKILTALPPDAPGIVIVQHMPEKFTATFANRLDSICSLKVKEGKTGDFIKEGVAIIAPGGKHLKVKRSGGHYCVEVFDGPLVNRHRPSVDVMFKSVAQQVGPNAAGFILTGMGDDGARGLKQMLDAGAYTVAQDEQSSVVFGMPKEAICLGAAKKILPLSAVAQEIMKCSTAKAH